MQLKAQEHGCEEADLRSREFYIPCNRPAKHIVGWEHRSEGPYRMCDMCTEHNVKNRGARIIGPYDAKREGGADSPKAG